MKTTRILGEAIGIQSQGIIDKTENQSNDRLTTAIIVGQFMRGRFDKPMVIHQANIRGQLGHEPQNPYYNAVQDCLDTGVPSVQVFRIGSFTDDGGGENGDLLQLSIDYPAAASGKITSASNGLVDVLGNSVGTVHQLDPNKAWGLGALWAIRFVFVDQNNSAKNFNITKTGRVTTDIIVNGWLLSSNIEAGNMQNGTLTCTFVLSFDEETPLQTIENLSKFVGGKSVGSPAWYVEDSPFGDVLAYFGQPKSVEIAISNLISCDGATNTFELPNDPDGSASTLITSIVLNGVNYPINEDTGSFNLPPDTITISYKRREKPNEESGYHWGYYIEVANVASEDMRVELVGYQNGVVEEYWDGSQNTNPTLAFVEGDTPKAIVCLSPKGSQISCEGAESLIRFGWFTGQWDVELDGVLHHTNGDNVPYFLRSNFGDILETGDDGFMNIQNKDSNPHRFKFIPLSETEFTAPTNNPTFLEHDDGSLTFCLSAQDFTEQ
ncbi:hypothetical protein [Acinetobacter sp. Ac_5812]|uniref:hypothetical protein n=1 Tax=Acinetobacter sp. Ac_5812 TaxID=1848937 RepID=UPI00209192C8|nr:hypothetical protein [Acinetobacter sp. Ac_5812]